MPKEKLLGITVIHERPKSPQKVVRRGLGLNFLAATSEPVELLILNDMPVPAAVRKSISTSASSDSRPEIAVKDSSMALTCVLSSFFPV